MGRLRLLAAVLVGAALLLAQGPLPAVADHSWGGYHWSRTSNPVVVTLGDNLSGVWKPRLTEVVQRWNTPSLANWLGAFVVSSVVVPGKAKGSCRPGSGRVEVCNDSYGMNNWLGLAQIWISGGHITQGSVKVNDTYFALPAYNNDTERNHVLCQEIGHTFGLGHTSEDGSSQRSCMDYSQDPNSQFPNAHDFEQLATIYSHLDSGGRPRPTPAATAQGDFDHPSEWGRRVRAAAGGRGAIFEREFGGGHKLETFVIYAN